MSSLTTLLILLTDPENNSWLVVTKPAVILITRHKAINVKKTAVTNGEPAIIAGAANDEKHNTCRTAVHID
jgi:hypothetical protein